MINSVAEAVLFRLGFSVMYAFILIINFNQRDDRERRTIATERVPRLTADIATAALYLLIIGVVWWAGNKAGWKWMMNYSFSVFVSTVAHMAAYDVIILLAMPRLRRMISARACSYLWSLPFFSFVAMRNFSAYPKSLLHISLPNMMARILFWIWIAGFAGVMLWKITSHLLFRHRILSDTRQPDANTIDLWREEQKQAGGVNMDYPLVISPHVTTPLSIGIFRWSIRVVLPERSYTQEELRLIFRHELIHINRGDGGNKMLRITFAASCWFFPVIWKAIHRSEEDMELSCDETVLLDATEEERQHYAGLLLRTAGDERGFTTCLAASAQTMRYRLKNVVQPVERDSGVLVLAVIFAVMLMTFGWFSLGYEKVSGHEVIFEGHELSEFVVADRSIREEKREELITYLAGLEFEKITGIYGNVSSKNDFDVVLAGPDGTFWVILTEESLYIQPFSSDRRRVSPRVVSEIDWEYLDSCLAPWVFQY